MTDTQNILIVDDDDYLLDIYSVKFEEAGIDVDAAESGEAALEMIEGEHKYEAMLLDLVMPAMSGFEVLEQMSKRGKDEEMRVIILSNQGQPDDVERAEQYGVDEYIVKANAVPSEVVEKVLAVLN